MSVEEAKLRLLLAAPEHPVADLVRDHPWASVLAAAGAGAVFARSPATRRMLVRGARIALRMATRFVAQSVG